MSMPGGDSGVSGASISRVTGSAVAAGIEPLLREYGEWAVAQLESAAGIRLNHAELEQYHDAFRRELPELLGSRGRLLCARIGQQLVGVGALKPVGEATAEIKRLYVRPCVQGIGIGRMILDRLLLEARDEGYERVQLETLRFMTKAQAMYRSAGFRETPELAGSQTAGTPLAPLAVYMGLDLADKSRACTRGYGSRR